MEEHYNRVWYIGEGKELRECKEDSSRIQEKTKYKS